MKTIVPLLAALWVVLILLSCPAWGQSKEEAIKLDKEGAALEKQARSQEDLKRAAEKYEQALRIYERLRDDKGIEVEAESLGIVYGTLREYDKAIESFEKCVQVSRKIGNLEGEGECLGNVCRAYQRRYQSKGDLDRAIEKCEQARKIFERLGKEEEIAHINAELGNAYSNLGDYDKALEYYEKCLKTSMKIGNTEMHELALHNLGALSINRALYREAIEYFEKALAISKRLGNKRDEAGCLSGIGSSYVKLGQYDKAVEYFNKVLDTALKLKDEDLEADALSDLAWVYRGTGDKDKAAQAGQKALATFEKNRNVQSEGNCLRLLGVLCADRGQYNEAIEYYQRSLEVAHKLGSPEMESSALLDLGWTYIGIGQYDQAMGYCQRVLKLAGQMDDPKGEGHALQQIGEMQHQRGDYASALETLKKAIAIFERTGSDTGWPRRLIVSIYLDLGDLDGARTYHESTGTDASFLEGRYYLFGDEYADYETAKMAFEKSLQRDTKGSDGFLADLTGMGLAHEKMQDYPKAAEYFTKAVEQTEEMRSGLHAAERAKFFDVKFWGFARTEPYEGLARVLMKLNKPAEALKQSEYTKARIFSESMSRRSPEASVNVPEDVLKKDARLNEHLASLIKKRQEAYEKGNREVIDSVEPQIKEVKSKIQSHIDMLRKDHPLFAATKYPQPMDVEQTAVKPEEWTLAYQVTDTGICIWLLKGKKLVKSLFKPIPRKELNQLVRAFRKPLDMEDITPKNLLAFKDALGTGKNLFTLLVGDFLNSIPQGQPLIILPDGMLGLLPFEMLVIKEGKSWNESSKRPYPEGVVYFGDRNPISYYQSLTALTLARTLGQVKKTGPRTLVMADPVFQSDDPRLQQMEKKRRAELLASVSDKLMSIKNETGLVFNRLPLTGELGTALKKLQPDLTDLYSGMDARKPLLFKEPLDKYRSVVFATHGYVGEGLPGIMEPVLVLTLVDQPKDKDGFLRMSEVMSLDLSADVVALTACQTGLGHEVKGEGTMGMGRAFQYAGAKSVLMSLWSVSEVSTTRMAEKFLSYLKQREE